MSDPLELIANASEQAERIANGRARSRKIACKFRRLMDRLIAILDRPADATIERSEVLRLVNMIIRIEAAQLDLASKQAEIQDVILDDMKKLHIAIVELADAQRKADDPYGLFSSDDHD